MQKHYPAATYEICRNEQGLPYIYDPLTGFMVFTKVTIDGITHEMWLPVMDGKNKAMKAEPYTYTVFDKYKNTNIEKTVDAATMFDVNKTLMRCFTKNLAMFGLGMYIYAGEDLPETPVPTAEEIIETIKIAENDGDIQAWLDYGINTYPARKSDFEEAARRGFPYSPQWNPCNHGGKTMEQIVAELEAQRHHIATIFTNQSPTALYPTNGDSTAKQFLLRWIF